MQIGFYSTVLGDQSIQEVARCAAGAGFACLEVDWARHVGQPDQAGAALAAVRGAGLEVCALTCFGNLMDADRAARDQARATARAAIDAALEHGVQRVVVFPGRNHDASEDENYRELAAYFNPLTEHAAKGNVRILIENWPGPHIDYLATTPAGWARLFELVPAPNLGLNFDPSHLVWQGIDPERALRAVADRVFLTHAKDTEIVSERLQQVGYFGSGWWTYRLPGHGRIDWRRWIALLRELGLDDVISIEHEDRDWGFGTGGAAERRREGLLEALNTLRTAADQAPAPAS